MKKFFVIIITLFVLLAVSASAEIYPQTFVVGDINRSTNAVAFVDYNGNIWTWEGIEDWMIGDIAAAIMDDNGTETIYDDMIITLRYAGYMEGWD